MAKNDGGAAFPIVFSERDDALLRSPGMSLRDRFAIGALGLGGEWFYNNSEKGTVAELAYQIADDMLAARGRD